MAGAADVDAAVAFWRDASTPVRQRCMAARAIGLLGEHGPKWPVEGVDDDESPLGRALRHGCADFQRRRLVEIRAYQKEDSLEKMRQLGAQSVADVIRLLLDRTVELEKRIAAAIVLRALRSRDAVDALTQVLIEGQPNLSNACAHALVAIGSRSVSRRLMRIVRGKYTSSIFWNADKTQSIPEANRELYTAAYARSGRMRAGWAHFVSFRQAAKDFSDFAKTKLPMPFFRSAGENPMATF